MSIEDTIASLELGANRAVVITDAYRIAKVFAPLLRLWCRTPGTAACACAIAAGNILKENIEDPADVDAVCRTMDEVTRHCAGISRTPPTAEENP